MGIDFSHRIKALMAEVEALKTASRSDSDGMNTITKTINFTAHLKVMISSVEATYFITIEPASGDDKIIFSVSQKPVAVSDDVIVDQAVPELKNGKIGVKLIVWINYQRVQSYIQSHSQGDIIDMPVSIKITASDDFTYTMEGQ